MKNFGLIVKEAEQFRQVQNEFAILVKLTNMPLKDVLLRSEISETYYRKLLDNPEKLKAKHIAAILRAVIEVQNFERVKNK
jgi:uncharacterized protein YqgQ